MLPDKQQETVRVYVLYSLYTGGSRLIQLGANSLLPSLPLPFPSPPPPLPLPLLPLRSIGPLNTARGSGVSLELGERIGDFLRMRYDTLLTYLLTYLLTVSSSSGVWGGAPAEIELGAF